MINNMNIVELKEKLDANAELILVDCREQDEWDAGHIEKATFIPLSEFAALWESSLKDKDATIVVQCRSGKRSLKACMLLMQEGFSNLYNLDGGIMAWQATGFDVVTK